MVREADKTILVITIILTVFGLLMIFSAGGTKYLLRQSAFFGIALVALIVFANLNPRVLGFLAPFLYIMSLVLLLAVLRLSPFAARRWIPVGDFSLQPSEFAKLFTILFLAHVMVNLKQKLSTVYHALLPIVIVGLPAVLVVIEPDLGAAQIFFAPLMAMLYWKGLNGFAIFLLVAPLFSMVASFSIVVWAVYIVLLSVVLFWRKRLHEIIFGLTTNSVFGLLTPLIWGSLKLYQKKRIITFLSPWLDPKGISWQLIQSKIAMGSGQIFGKGFLAGTQKKLEFLPERHTDFIFSCIGEEFGFLGTGILLALYLVLSYRILLVAKESHNEFHSLVAAGIWAMLSYQIVLNIGMTIGIFPVTGVPLPFISYGGSSLLVNFIAIGIVLSLSKRKLEY